MIYAYSERESAFLNALKEKLGQFAAQNPMDEPSQLSRENIFKAMTQLAQTPYLRMTFEEADKRDGMTSLMTAMEGVAAISPSLFLSVEYSIRFLGRAIARWANKDQRERFLTPLLEGRCLGALALCEQSAEDEDDYLSITGKRQGKAVVISGIKDYVVNGPVAAVIGVSGRLDGRPAIFMLEENTPGLWVNDSGETFGYPGTTFSTVRMEGCSVPEENVFFADGESDFTATLRFWENHVLIGASLGLTLTALKTARDYAEMKKCGGEPLGTNPAIKLKLAEMSSLYQGARMMAMRAAYAAENDPVEASDLTLCAKLFCTETAEKVSSDALNILGARGCFGSNPVQLAFRCAKYGHVFGSKTEFSRVKLGDMTLESLG